MKLLRVVFLILSLIFFSTNVLAQEDSNKILFLDFQFIKDIPELINISVVDGKLKIHKNDLHRKTGYSITVLSIYKYKF